ncbi:MAG: Gfo/Idh/MocA family oxidoreductase, partial [Spirochaetaceae bacterium]|nr:Gfo/Idh/MocA family oxidoreductase [Spirochaetaceae bacterium]
LIARQIESAPGEASASFKLTRGYDEHMVAWLRYSNGISGSIEAWFDAASDQRLIVVGTKGVLESSDFFGGGGEPMTLTTFAEAGPLTEMVAVENTDMYMLEVLHFSNAVLGKPAVLVSRQETLANMRTMDVLHAHRA